jgi:hypothetical protein
MRVRISEKKFQFLQEVVPSKLYADGLTKFTAIVAVMLGTKRPSNDGQCILDQVVLGKKLHDGEPELVVACLEKRFGEDFFAKLPHRGDLTPEKKKEFISEFCGYLRYGAKHTNLPE